MGSEKKNSLKQTRVKKNQASYGKKIIVKSYKIHRSIIFFLCFSLLLNSYSIYHFLTFNHKKVKINTKIEEKKVVPDNYLFLGDSITEFYDLKKYYGDLPVVNSGKGGNITTDILNNMKERIYDYNPSKVFLLIGTNDIKAGKNNSEIAKNIEGIISGIKNNRPETKIYVESIYPVNRTIENNGTQNRHNEDIQEINQIIKEYCKKTSVVYIDIYSLLLDDNGNLKREYTQEGLHISEAGYEVITKKIKSYFD